MTDTRDYVVATLDLKRLLTGVMGKRQAMMGKRQAMIIVRKILFFLCVVAVFFTIGYESGSPNWFYQACFRPAPAYKLVDGPCPSKTWLGGRCVAE